MEIRIERDARLRPVGDGERGNDRQPEKKNVPA